MNQLNKILFGFILFPLLIQAQSLDSNVFKYFPLKVGNTWTWYRQNFYSLGPGYESIKIFGTTVLNNKLYYTARNDIYNLNTGQHLISKSYWRIDSANGNLVNYNTLTQSDCLVDSLNSQKGDSTMSNCSTSWFRCDTGTYSMFNQNPKTKLFIWSDYFEADARRIYARNFGKVYAHMGAVSNYTFWYLHGCVIDGVLYGDTSILVGINEVNTEVPKQFSLSQNYPNPFNPSTSIKFSVPLKSFVTITIYSVLGEKMARLINEEFSPGTYETNWDAASFPSGVYYYQLTVSSEQLIKYTETKKMVLIK